MCVKKKLVMIAMFMMLGSLVLSACCGEIRYKHEVEVGPLYNLPVPLPISDFEAIENSDFISIFFTHDGVRESIWNGLSHRENPRYININVNVWIADVYQRAFEYFDQECNDDSFEKPNRFEFGGEGDNRYCVSYLVQYRHSLDSFCYPTGSYNSYVVFQKGNIVVTVRETTRDKESQVKEEVIARLAEIFAGQP